MRTKTLLLFVVAVMTLFTACKKNDDKTNAEKIQGKWSLVTMVLTGKDTGNSINDVTTGTAADYTEFKADGTFTSVVAGITTTGTYSINGDQITLKGTASDSPDETTIEVDTIKTLTENSLILYNKENSNDPNNCFETTITLKK